MPVLGGSASPTITETATDNGVTITVTSEADSARMAIDLEGGPVDEPVYVLRRDRQGQTDVRPTSAGTVLWVAGTPTTVPTVYDYEARQELETDYTVTDLDGLPLVTVRVVIPRWGPWLKNPGKPHQNMPVLWFPDQDYTREVPQTILQPRGAKFPIVLSHRRTSPAGQIKVMTETDEQARSFTTLISDGQALMVDVPDSFGVPVRYVSVGSVKGSRPTDREVESELRIWTMDVVEVAAPVGLPAGQDFTYEGLSTLSDTYRGLPVLFSTYDDMAVGLET